MELSEKDKESNRTSDKARAKDLRVTFESVLKRFESYNFDLASDTELKELIIDGKIATILLMVAVVQLEDQLTGRKIGNRVGQALNRLGLDTKVEEPST
jgi:hypothetical protein